MAYQLTVFETVEEFFDAVADGTIPDTLYVVCDDGPPRLSGNEGAAAFSLELLSWDDLIKEMFARVGMQVHFT